MSGIRPSTDVDAERTPDAPGVPIRRVLKACEQIAEQLRDLIASGKLSPGERLPNEGNLARQFGVSRATVRESLRVLTAQNLIRTAKGSGGGSYVTLPTVDHLSEFLRANFDLLTASQDVSLDDFLEIRMLLEVPAARLADDDRYADFAGRDRNRDDPLAELDAAFATAPSEEWLRRLGRASIPCGPVNDVRAAIADPQAVAREAFVETAVDQSGVRPLDPDTRDQLLGRKSERAFPDRRELVFVRHVSGSNRATCRRAPAR